MFRKKYIMSVALIGLVACSSSKSSGGGGGGDPVISSIEAKSGIIKGGLTVAQLQTALQNSDAGIKKVEGEDVLTFTVNNHGGGKDFVFKSDEFKKAGDGTLYAEDSHQKKVQLACYERECREGDTPEEALENLRWGKDNPNIVPDETREATKISKGTLAFSGDILDGEKKLHILILGI